MRKRFITQFLTLALSTSIILTGCGNSGGNAENSSAAKDSLSLRLSAEINSFDPAFASSTTDLSVINQMYDFLFMVFRDHSYEPSLAESFEISEDNLTYTFKLKEGVTFHNGESFTADDVVFTINRALDSAWQYSLVEQIESASAIDDYTVAVKLKAPFALFFEVISSLPILDETTVTDAGESYADFPIGTGPYKFVSYENASTLKLTRFDEYHQGAAAIKDLNYSTIVDPNTSNIALETGEVDFGGFTASAMENMKSNENLLVTETPSNNLRYICMNVEKEPFNNKLVRQAINYAIDREFIVNAAESGLAKPTSEVINSNIFGYNEGLPTYDYNPEKAKELLAEAGITTPLNIGSIKTIDGSFKKVAEVLQSNLADIGIIADIEMLEQNKYLEDVMGGNFTICSFGSSPGIDADNFSVFFTPENIDGGYNTARYNNPEITEYFRKGRITLDPEERLKIYKECFTIIQEEAVIAPIYIPTNLVARNKNLDFKNLDKSTGIFYFASWK